MNVYKNNETNEIVKITKNEDSFYLLNNGLKIDKMLFNLKYVRVVANDNINTHQPNNAMNEAMSVGGDKVPPTTINASDVARNHFVGQSVVEDVDEVVPIDFLNTTTYNMDDVNKIQNFDSSKILDNQPNPQPQIRNLNDSPIVRLDDTPLEKRKQDLLDEYEKSIKTNITKDNIAENLISENGLTQNQEFMRKSHMDIHIGEDPYEKKIIEYRKAKGFKDVLPVIEPRYLSETELNDINDTNNDNNQINTQPPQPPQHMNNVDPTYDIFKKFKRNYDVEINFKINEKISKPDFIKLMADGLEGDIIQYYTDIIFNDFIMDQDNLKKNIYERLNFIVYGEGKKKNKPKNKKTATKNASNASKTATKNAPKTTKTATKNVKNVKNVEKTTSNGSGNHDKK